MTNGDNEYQDIYVSAMIQGMDKSTHVSKIGQERWAQLLNVWHRKGLKKRRPGLKQFGSNLPLNGAYMGTWQVVWNDGSEELITLTTRDAYRYDTANDEWDFVTQRYNTGTVTTGGAGNRTVTLAGGTFQTYWPNDVMEIGFDDTDPENITTWYSVSKIDNATQLTLSEDGPVKAGVTYVLRICFSGDEDNIFNIEIISDPNNNQCFVTNQVDRPQKLTAAGNMTEYPGLSAISCTGVLTAIWYESRLNLYYPTEGGTTYPHRVRRSVKGDPEDFTGSGSGLNDITEVKGFIIGAAKLKGGIAIYKERGIVLQTYKGDAATGEIYNFVSKAEGFGLVAQGLLVSLGSSHLFGGNDNFYFFDGITEPVPVKGWVRDDIFGFDSNINWGGIPRAFICYIEESNEAHIFLPSGESSYNDICYALEVDDEEFHYHEFAKDITGYGYYTRYGDVTWNDLSGTWLDQTWRWNDRVMLANAPVTLFGDKDGYVYSYDSTVDDDDGTAISQKYRAKQIEIPGSKVRVGEIEFRASGGSASLYYSINEGESWTLLKTFTLTAALARHMVAPHHTFEQIMYELRSDTALDIEWARISAKEVPDR